jgi:hypothetical protein
VKSWNEAFLLALEEWIKAEPAVREVLERKFFLSEEKQDCPGKKNPSALKMRFGAVRRRT